MSFCTFDDFLYVTMPRLCFLIVAYYSLSFLYLLIRNLIFPIVFSKRNEIKQFGRWVIITGATDGIGKGFAEILAKDKHNLVLISRTKEKLEKVKSEILSENNVEIKLICADFTKVDIYEKIEKEIKDLDVSLLINNVGISNDFPDFLTSDSNANEKVVNMINCNCVSTVLMTRMLLKTGMLPRGGFILNISSVASVIPTPLWSVYSGTKALINWFSVSMRAELCNRNVYVQNVAPFYVSTNMSKVKPSLTVPTAKSYANSVLNRLGTYWFTHGCLVHEIQGWFVSCVPISVLSKMVFGMTSQIRIKALRKAEKAK